MPDRIPDRRTVRRAGRVLPVLLGLLFAGAPAAAADAVSAIDLHALWDDRCASCHGDAGAFARRTLTLHDGRLQGRHPVGDLALFLRNHYLADALVPRVMAMLAAQVATPPHYATRCAGCHGRASDLVRDRLILEGGRLLTRTGRRDVGTLLQSHGGLVADEQGVVLQSLIRVLGEVGR